MKKIVFSLTPLALLYVISETVLSTINLSPFSLAPKTGPPVVRSRTSPWGDTRVVEERLFLGTPTTFELPHRFRAFRPPVSKVTGVKRIVFIGDSFMFGVGIAEYETLPFGLSAYLRHYKPELAVEMVNLGIPGADTQTYVQLCEIGETYQPDLVVLSFTIGNDADIDPKSLLNLHQSTDIIPDAARASKKSIWEALTGLKGLRNLVLPHSRTFSALYKPLRKFEAKERQDAYMRRTFDENWAKVGQNLKTFSSYYSDQGVPVILLIYPHMFATIDVGLNDIKTYPYERYHQRVIDLAKSVGFMVVNVLDCFRQENIGSLDNYLVNGDGHPNGAFNAFVARRLCREPSLISVPLLSDKH